MKDGIGEIRHFEIDTTQAPVNRLALEQSITALAGVTGVWVDATSGRLSVRGTVRDALVLAAVGSCGHRAKRMPSRRLRMPGSGLEERLIIAVSAIAVLLVVDTFAQALSDGILWRAIGLLTAVPATLWAGGRWWRNAMRGGLGRCCGLEGLLAASVAASWLHAAIELVAPEWLPDVASGGYLVFPLLAVTLHLGARLLERRTIGPGHREANNLRAVLPLAAAVECNDGLRRVPLRALRAGQRMRVGPGERVPADGVLISGKALVDESLMSGDPSPTEKAPGDGLVGGTLNRQGRIMAEVRRGGEASRLHDMIHGARQATREKPIGLGPVAGIATLALAIGALAALTALAGWWALAGNPGWGVFSACMLLILAAPAALALASPVANHIGLARLIRYGVVARRGDVLEAMQALTVMVVDKAGMLTVGEPEVVAVEPVEGVAVRELFRLAAALETGDRPGPVARAAAERNLTLPDVGARETLEDGGVRARVEGRTVLLGNADTIAVAGIDNPLAERSRELQDEASSPLFVAVADAVIGIVALADTARPEVASALQRMRSARLRIIMLSGDNQRTARAFASNLGIDEVLVSASPEDEVHFVRSLQHRGERVGMVGGGLNDAAALVQADVGFAVAGGDDVVVQSADATLLRDSLHAVVDSVRMARVVARNVRENAAIAYAYSGTAAPIAAGLFYTPFGWSLSPGVLGVFLLLAALTVLINANRLRFHEILDAESC